MVSLSVLYRSDRLVCRVLTIRPPDYSISKLSNLWILRPWEYLCHCPSRAPSHPSPDLRSSSSSHHLIIQQQQQQQQQQRVSAVSRLPFGRPVQVFLRTGFLSEVAQPRRVVLLVSSLVLWCPAEHLDGDGAVVLTAVSDKRGAGGTHWRTCGGRHCVVIAGALCACRSEVTLV